MITKAVQRIRNKDKEKVQMNLKMTAELKQHLDMHAENNGISTTALINSILEMAVTDQQASLIDLQDLFKDLERAENEYIDLMTDGISDADEARRADQLQRYIRLMKREIDLFAQEGTES